MPRQLVVDVIITGEYTSKEYDIQKHIHTRKDREYDPDVLQADVRRLITTGKFRDVGTVSGPGFALKKVSRTLAVGDLDNDGDLDVLIGNNGHTADLLRNDGGNRSNALLIRTVGSKSNRDGIGARVKLTLNGTVLLRYVKAGSSYQGQNDLRVHFGLGTARMAERLEILWPSGGFDSLENVEANQILTISEGRVSRIKEIKFIGIHDFSRSDLIPEMTLSTSNVFTYFT